MATSVNTTSILEDLRALEARKLEAIQELLKERTTLQQSTDKRLTEITSALKELGHKRKVTRKPKVEVAKTAKAK